MNVREIYASLERDNEFEKSSNDEDELTEIIELKKSRNKRK